MSEVSLFVIQRNVLSIAGFLWPNTSYALCGDALAAVYNLLGVHSYLLVVDSVETGIIMAEYITWLSYSTW
jgi:hypothetical protein